MAGIFGSSEAKRRAQHSAGRSAARKTAGVFFIAEILLPELGRGKARLLLEPGFAAIFAVPFAECSFQHSGFAAGTDDLDGEGDGNKDPEKRSLQRQRQSKKHYHAEHVNR